MSISLYRPARLSEMMDRMFDENFFGPRPVSGFGVPLDVYVTDEDYLLRAVVPGLKAEDLSVEISDNTVTIKGEVRPPVQPNELDGAKAEAHVENGLLTLRIPKAEAAKPKVVKVKAK